MIVPTTVSPPARNSGYVASWLLGIPFCVKKVKMARSLAGVRTEPCKRLVNTAGSRVNAKPESAPDTDE